jgi:hypothetical protein
VKSEPIANVQFSLETLFLIITALALYLAALIAAPLVGATVMAVGVPALVRTVIHTTRELGRGRHFRLADKIESYCTSLVATFLALSAAMATLLVATVLFSVTALFAATSSSAVLDFIAAAVGVLGCLAFLLLSLPVFHCFYWQTLPPENEVGLCGRWGRKFQVPGFKFQVGGDIT